MNDNSALNIGVCGVGTVGLAVIDILSGGSEMLSEQVLDPSE